MGDSGDNVEARASTKLASWEVSGADLAQRPPERAPEGQARLAEAFRWCLGTLQRTEKGMGRQ